MLLIGQNCGFGLNLGLGFRLGLLLGLGLDLGLGWKRLVNSTVDCARVI